MKTLILIIFASTTSFAQFSLYMPKNTMHFVKMHQGFYTDNQGGDIGMVFSYKNNKSVYSFGNIKNSFGLNSFILTIGRCFKVGTIDLITSFGLSSGYKDIYNMKRHEPFDKLPSILKRNGIIPIGLVSLKVPLFENIGLQFNVSPSYVNTGFFINLK